MRRGEERIVFVEALALQTESADTVWTMRTEPQLSRTAARAAPLQCAALFQQQPGPFLPAGPQDKNTPQKTTEGHRGSQCGPAAEEGPSQTARVGKQSARAQALFLSIRLFLKLKRSQMCRDALMQTQVDYTAAVETGNRLPGT